MKRKPVAIDLSIACKTPLESLAGYTDDGAAHDHPERFTPCGGVPIKPCPGVDRLHVKTATPLSACSIKGG